MKRKPKATPSAATLASTKRDAIERPCIPRKSVPTMVGQRFRPNRSLERTLVAVDHEALTLSATTASEIIKIPVLFEFFYGDLGSAGTGVQMAVGLRCGGSFGEELRGLLSFRHPILRLTNTHPGRRRRSCDRSTTGPGWLATIGSRRLARVHAGGCRPAEAGLEAPFIGNARQCRRGRNDRVGLLRPAKHPVQVRAESSTSSAPQCEIRGSRIERQAGHDLST